MKDVTAVVINWLTARRTLGAIDSFRKYYPNMKLLVVDDASDEKDWGLFHSTYGSTPYKAKMVFDPDTDKLKGLPKSKFIQAPDFGNHAHSHGQCMDYVKDKIKTTWMFQFHSDFRFIEPGYIEFLMEGIDDSYAGVGDGKTRHPRCRSFGNVATLYNLKLIKKHKLSFDTVIYYDDDTTSPFPGNLDPTKKGGVPLEAGMCATGRLHQKGYKLKDVGYGNYGVHLRFYGDEEEWKRLF